MLSTSGSIPLYPRNGCMSELGTLLCANRREKRQHSFISDAHTCRKVTLKANSENASKASPQVCTPSSDVIYPCRPRTCLSFPEADETHFTCQATAPNPLLSFEHLGSSSTKGLSSCRGSTGIRISLLRRTEKKSSSQKTQQPLLTSLPLPGTVQGSRQDLNQNPA